MMDGEDWYEWYLMDVVQKRLVERGSERFPDGMTPEVEWSLSDDFAEVYLGRDLYNVRLFHDVMLIVGAAGSWERCGSFWVMRHGEESRLDYGSGSSQRRGIAMFGKEPRRKCE